MNKVFKYATGVEIPEGAQYLSTQVEKTCGYQQEEDGTINGIERNRLVWHYFLVEAEEQPGHKLS